MGHKYPSRPQGRAQGRPPFSSLPLLHSHVLYFALLVFFCRTSMAVQRVYFLSCTVQQIALISDGLPRTIDIEYNKRLDRQRPCLEGDLTAGSNL